mmetsp:Transcript_8788/g.19539  ORF Transcript_8788/g.19539 Transcript_8788/m.19539 type:complete len:215 (-) Transcript_8788:485-1129(-)
MGRVDVGAWMLVRCQRCTPIREARRGVALIPVLVSTTTVVCDLSMAPLASSSWYAAAACAQVGSVYSPSCAHSSVAAAICSSVTRTAPPLQARRADTHSARRMGLAMEVPSAIVFSGTFHSDGACLPSSCPTASRKADAMGLHASGCAQKSRGSCLISPALSSSLKPMSQPRMLDPAPVGMMMLSGALNPRSSHSSYASVFVPCRKNGCQLCDA